MKSAKVIYKIAYLIIALMVAVFAVGYAFAWFLDRKDAEFSITGSSEGAYFESGDGTPAIDESTGAKGPFIISNRTHMHNLAVLQNSGKLDQKYYFQIKPTVETIDMGGIWMPPIGNDEHPFIGDFNGNGKAIVNLKVTTNKTLIKDEYPNHAVRGENPYLFSQAVGLFGMTGTTSNIHNVILDNPTVYVSATDTDYSSTARAYAGLAIGYVNGRASSIGVRALNDGSALDVKKTGYSSFNSILGALGSGVESSVTGGGHGQGGSGAAFGASFDVNALLQRLLNIYQGKYGTTYKKSGTPIDNGLPLIDTANDNPVPAGGEKVPFSIDESKSKYTYTADAGEVVSDQNTGYFIGNQNKINEITVNFGGELQKPSDQNASYVYDNNSDAGLAGKTPLQAKRTPRQFFKSVGGNVNYSATNIAELTEEEYDELPDSIKAILKTDEGTTQKSFDAIRLVQRFGNTGITSNQNDTWGYHGTVSWMGTTYGSETNQIALPNNAIWFKPSQVGKFRFVIYSGKEEKGSSGFRLYKITRNSATKENPFYGTDVGVQQVTYNQLANSEKLPPYIFFYFEYEVSLEEFNEGKTEFMLMKGDNDQWGYFVYMDLGAAAVKDTSTVVENKVSAVDFIYDKVEINQNSDTTDSEGKAIAVGNFIVRASGSTTTAELYESSKTSVWFQEINAALNLVFIRLHEDTESKHSGKTICLEKSNPVPDTNSEVKATFATYVCPTIGGGSGTVIPGGDTPASPSISGASSVTVGSAPFKLTANNLSGTLDWSSSNENVATVDSSGNVTLASGAKAGDTVTITATGTNGSASITITVTAAQTTVEVESVEITNAKTMTVGQELALTAKVSPENATDSTVTWEITSAGTTGATITNGKLTATAAGEVTVKATAGGKSATATITVNAAAYHSGTFTFTAPDTVSAGSGYTGNLNNIITQSVSSTDSGWQLGSNSNYVNLALNVQSGKVITISLNGRRTGASAQGVNVYVDDTLLGLIDLTTNDAQGDKTLSYTATEDGVINLKFNRSAGSGTNISKIVVTIADGSTTPDPEPTHTHSYTWTVSTAPTASVKGEATGTCTSTTGTCTAQTVKRELPVLSDSGYTTKDSSTTGYTTYTYAFDGSTVSFDVIKTYTVTFDSQGGTAVAANTVEHGGKVSAPADPTRTGYDFGGWFTEAACTTAYNFNNAVSGNLTLYAKWTAATVAVTDISISNTTVKAGETLDLTATVEPDNATDKTVEWSITSTSSDTVKASFSDTGLYIAADSASGTVTLTATAGSFTKDFEITVTTAAVDPTPTAVTASKTASWTALSANDTILEGKSESGATVFKVSAATALSLNGGKNTSVTTSKSGDVLTFDLATGYTYTITLKVGSQGASGKRRLTLNGVENGQDIRKTTDVTKFEEYSWTISSGGTYSLSAASDLYMSEITVVATPIT